MNSVILAIVVLALLGIGALGLALLIPALMEQLPTVQTLRAEIAEHARKILALNHEIENAKTDRKRVDDEAAKIDKDHRQLVARRNMFPVDKPLPVVEHGLPVQTNKLFEVYVHNPAVRRAHRNGEAPPVNPFWEEPRYVVVWAEGLTEARAEINSVYPQVKEWHVEVRGEVPT